MTSQRLGEFLIEEGRLRPEQLERALETQKLVGGRLGTNLLELGLVSESRLLKALGHLRATQTVDAADLRAAQPDVIRMIPAKLATRYKLVPYLVKGKTIFIASKDPGDPLQEDEIGFLTSCMVRTCIATELRLEIALRRFYQVAVDRRFLILGKRLARGSAGPSASPSPSPSSSASPSASSSSSSSPSPSSPPAQSSPPAAPAMPTSAVAPTPGKVSEPGPPPTKKAEPAEPQFIELDADDLASLRRPAEPDEAPPDDLPASPPQPPQAVQPAPGEEPLPLGSAAPEVPDFAAPDAESAEAAEAEAWLEDVAAAEASDDADLGVEERLARASTALQDAEIRDEIGDALLRFAGAYYERRVLLISRRDRIFGWMGDGEGVELGAVRAVDLEAQKPSVFAGLREASSFWLGPLPPLPSNQRLAEALGGAPRDCLVLPVILRGKVVCYLYVDNGPADPDSGDAGRAVSGTPIAEMKRLVAKAGLAFEVYILKHKIRVS